MATRRKSVIVFGVILLALLGFWIGENRTRGSSTAWQNTDEVNQAAASPHNDSIGDDEQERGRVHTDKNLADEGRGEDELFIYVVGHVRRPGVYRLYSGARVFEAIEAAGGVLPDARPDYLNLAAPLHDGEKVWVPSKDDVEEGHVPGPPIPPLSSHNSAKLDLNTATIEELQTLPGIGPKLAAAIIEERERRGPFNGIDDLTRVSGIGSKTVQRLRAWLEQP